MSVVDEHIPPELLYRVENNEWQQREEKLRPRGDRGSSEGDAVMDITTRHRGATEMMSKAEIQAWMLPDDTENRNRRRWHNPCGARSWCVLRGWGHPG